ncbi:MAG: hypothetical protein OEW58_06835 [Gammaproteobacteria bacterium]|nr:hypothetical protein [Gammaproteobacteria bacterium]
MKRSILSVALGVVLLGCATQPTADDPLKNTKRLVSEGHADLYRNGAFHVPNTQVALIPPGPSAVELGTELMGWRARQSFVTAVINAKDSVYLVADGTKKSYQLAKGIHEGTDEVAQYITDHSRAGSRLLIYKAYPKTKHIIGSSWELAGDSARVLSEFGDNLADTSLTAAAEISRDSASVGRRLVGGSWRMAGDVHRITLHGAKSSAGYAWDEFVEGYAALPQRLGDRAGAVAESVTLSGYARALDKSLEYRAKRSQFYTDIVVDGTGHYVEGVQQSFRHAGEAFDEVDETGISLATLKATRWVLQGLFWDGMIKPVGATAVGAVGYVTVNAVTFPTMLVVRSTVPTAEIAVQVTWNTAGAFYDVVAPTAIAATASIFSVTQLAVGETAAAASAVGGTAVGGSVAALGQGGAAVVAVSGFGAGKTVKYVGVPMAAAGIAVTGTATGVVVGTGAAATGATVAVAGETTAVGTQVMGNVLAASTLVVGTTATVVGSTGVGVYELSKAVMVPTSYALGGGIVLGYGSTSQLAAHSILAVADASYLVLSLEGPRWVIYAVKGKTGDGRELAPGTVLNLEKMQQQGEEFYYLPVSEQETRAVLDSLPADLPTVRAGEE